jgi:hypothetical protein
MSRCRGIVKRGLQRSLVALMCIGFSSCSRGEATSPEPKLYNGWAVNANTRSSEIEIVAVHRDGWVLAQTASRLPGVQNGSKGIHLTSPEGATGTLWLDANQRPAMVVSAGVVVTFQNWSATTVDLAVVRSDGQVRIFRSVSVPTVRLQDNSLGSIAARTFSAASSSEFSPEDLLVFLRSASLGWGVATCVIGVVSAPSGVTVPLVAIGCGVTVLQLTATLTESVGIIESADALSSVVSAAGCARGDPFACLDFLVGRAIDAAAIDTQRIQAASNEIGLANGALLAGAGEVQITLTWNNSADLDLWVTGPDNYRIFYGARLSPTGGRIDVDDIDGYGPENVYWPTSRAPAGRYSVQVSHFSGASPADFRVLVQSAGHVRSYSGTAASSQVIPIVSFTKGQPLPAVSRDSSQPALRIGDPPKDALNR